MMRSLWTRRVNVVHVAEPKPAPRETIHVRLRPGAIAEIDAVAAIEQRTRSDMARILIAEGLKVVKRRQEMNR